ncbi:hypothetical protein CDAR_375551 [Caerostris darwini]|uniref:Uncharacterized protein n=1 Tax=Caerostris darwini TaxID=1538125 RepID=A0AAV4S9U7_9ARAC|nr:hypothetical protein CDAR_375551 [Caerostris darwini]
MVNLDAPHATYTSFLFGCATCYETLCNSLESSEYKQWAKVALVIQTLPDTRIRQHLNFYYGPLAATPPDRRYGTLPLDVTSEIGPARHANRPRCPDRGLGRSHIFQRSLPPSSEVRIIFSPSKYSSIRYRYRNEL